MAKRKPGDKNRKYKPADLSFTPFKEEPPKRNYRRHQTAKWMERLKAITSVGEWYLIGIWNSEQGAAGAAKRLKAEFLALEFRSTRLKGEGKSKLYAMKVKGVPVVQA